MSLSFRRFIHKPLQVARTLTGPGLLLRWLLLAVAIHLLFFVTCSFFECWRVYTNFVNMEKQALAGDVRAERVLAYEYLTGRYGRMTFGRYGQDKDRGDYWFTVAAAQSGNSDAAYSIAQRYEHGFTGPRVRTALDWYHTAAMQGNSAATSRLSEIYQNGLLGQSVNVRLAEQWHRKAIVLNRQHNNKSMPNPRS